MIDVTHFKLQNYTFCDFNKISQHFKSLIKNIRGFRLSEFPIKDLYRNLVLNFQTLDDK